jgi:hypothetical protein
VGWGSVYRVPRISHSSLSKEQTVFAGEVLRVTLVAAGFHIVLFSSGVNGFVHCICRNLPAVGDGIFADYTTVSGVAGR